MFFLKHQTFKYIYIHGYMCVYKYTISLLIYFLSSGLQVNNVVLQLHRQRIIDSTPV